MTTQNIHNIDRKTAYLLNPLISPDCTSETLGLLKEICGEIACFCSPDISKAMQLLLPVSAALAYEEAATKTEVQHERSL